MTINFTLDMSVAPDGNIRVKTYDESAPSSPDATKDYLAPLVFPMNGTIQVPRATPHTVKIYDSPGGSDDGTLLADFLYDPSFNSAEIRADKIYTVGGGDPGDPSDSDTELTDTTLAGYDYEVEIRGVGTMIWGTEVKKTDTGGFSLLQQGDKFYQDQVIVVHFAPLITTYTPSNSISGPDFGAEIRADKIYTVGGGDPGDPSDSDTELTDTTLAGYGYGVEIRGVGTMIWGTEVKKTDTGGFSLLQSGDKFHQGQVIVVHFAPLITYTPSHSGGGGGFLTGIIKITTDKTLTSEHYGRLLDLSSSSNVLTITLPALTGTPDNVLFAMATSASSQVNTTITAVGSDNILWGTGQRQKMYMGRNEALWLMKAPAGWYVLQSVGNFDRVGQMIFSDKVLPNTIKRDGSLLLRAQYPRLFNDYVSKLDMNMMVSESSWNHFSGRNKGFYTLGTDSTNFRIPDSRALFVRSADENRGVDVGRLPGSFQNQDIQEHSHTIHFEEYMDGAAGDPGYKGGHNHYQKNVDKDTSISGGDETRPVNEARIALILI